MRPAVWAVLAFSVLCCMCCAAAGQETIKKDRDTNFFSISQDRKLLVEKAQAKANETGQLMLLVLGANWCHDSKSLALQLQSDAVKDVIAGHYVLTVLDAGWLDNLYDLLVQFDHPAYFGTPSLFIIDPASSLVLNRDSVQRWQSAHSESEASLAHYLEQFAARAQDRKQQLVRYFNAHEQQYAQVQQFEREQAARLYKGYSKLGSKLASEWQGNESVNIDELWNEVRRYRYQLQHDLVLHYESLESEQPVLVEYNQFSFE